MSKKSVMKFLVHVGIMLFVLVITPKEAVWYFLLGYALGTFGLLRWNEPRGQQ